MGPDLNGRSPVGPHLPLRASGTFEGHSWEFRASIEDDAAHTYFEVRDPFGSGGGGGGVGALPFQNVGGKVLGHIGTTGWGSGDESSGSPQLIDGVISATTATVRIHFGDGSAEEALVVDSGQPQFKFFVLPFGTGRRWRSIVALDVSGKELDRTVSRD